MGVDIIIKGEAGPVFCAIRPPGHHAERGKAMGFCLFNNIAVTAAYALKEYGFTSDLFCRHLEQQSCSYMATAVDLNHFERT